MKSVWWQLNILIVESCLQQHFLLPRLQRCEMELCSLGYNCGLNHFRMLLSQITAYLPRHTGYFCSSLLSMIASHYNYYKSGPTQRQESAEGARRRSINRNLNPLLSADIGDRLAREARSCHLHMRSGHFTLWTMLLLVAYQGGSACGRECDELSAGWHSTVRGNTPVCTMGISTCQGVGFMSVLMWSFIADSCMMLFSLFIYWLCFSTLKRHHTVCQVTLQVCT